MSSTDVKSMQSPSFLEVDINPTQKRRLAKSKPSSSKKMIAGALLAVVVLGLIASNTLSPSASHLAAAKKEPAKKEAAKKDDGKAKCGLGCKIGGFFKGITGALMFWKSKNPMVSLDVYSYMDCNGDSLKENRLVCDKKTRVRKYDIDKGDLLKVNKIVKAFGLVGNVLNFEIDRVNNLGEETKINVCWLDDDKKDKKIKEDADQKFTNCKDLTFKKKDLKTDGLGLGSDKHWIAYLILKEDRTFNTLLTQAELDKRDKSKEPWGKLQVKVTAAVDKATKKVAADKKATAVKPAADKKVPAGANKKAAPAADKKAAAPAAEKKADAGAE